ncbi:MAG: hypothetical protein V2A54_03270 [Bacteroidota bacterium]
MKNLILDFINLFFPTQEKKSIAEVVFLLVFFVLAFGLMILFS